MAQSKKQQQLINKIEQRCQLVREFMNDWLLFNQILSAYPKPGVNKAELENQFLKVKSKLAREHRVLQETLGSDYQLDGNTMNIVSGATSLETIYGQSDMSVKKLQQEWHRAFISINETLGGLEDKKARAERGEKVSVGVGPEVNVSGGMSPTMKRNLIIVGVLVVVLAGIFLSPLGQIWIDAFQDLVR